tara:strand:- start:2109 stop:3254 length:1146 start_codon:yes stop_codon:yes gene_type:complete
MAKDSLLNQPRIDKQRILEHKKGFRVTSGEGVPLNTEGNNGELTLRITRSGLKLFCKFRNHWYVIGEQSLKLASGSDGDVSGSESQGTTTINSRTGDLLMGGIINMAGSSSRSGSNRLQGGYDLKSDTALSNEINATGYRGKGLRFQSLNDNLYIDDVHAILEATKKLYLDGGTETYIHEVSADKLELVVGGDQMLTLDEANQRVTIEADKISYKTVGGTVKEFSPADSAYAGMILGYTSVGVGVTTATYAVTNAWAVVNTHFRIEFVAPPSGKVEISCTVFDDPAGARPLYLGLSDNTTYNRVSANYENHVLSPDGTEEQQISHSWTVTGLTAGTQYTYYLGAKSSHNSFHVLKWGGGADEYGPFIFKATALPATIYDGT